MDMTRLVTQLQVDEGVRLKPYRDSVGKLTIGVGRNLDDVGVSLEEATLMLEHDVRRTEVGLDANLPWWREMNDARQNVIMNMGFNLGIRKLLGFTNTLRAMEQGDWEAAATGMLASKWAGQVGERAVRLSKIMRTGRFQ
jgi:lysozyme